MAVYNVKVHILTEGGGKIGMGHISRCTALQEKLTERGAETFLHTDEAWRREGALGFLEGCSVIVDSYLVSDERLLEITRLARQCMYIDDNNIRRYPEGIVINPSLYGHTLAYPVLPGVRYMLGKDYVILRKPFRQVMCKDVTEEIGTVTVTIGGTDPLGLTALALQVLRGYKGIIKNVVVNQASPCYDDVCAYKDSATHIYENLCAEAMRDVLGESDLVISAAGQTIHELIQMRVPSLFVPIADNQRRNMDSIRANGLGLEISCEEFADDVAKKIAAMDNSTRRLFCENMKQFDFSKGVDRIVDAFLM